MMSAKNPGLGTLSILPRELRDEIYRYSFKGHYGFYYRYIASHRWTLGSLLQSRTIFKADVALLFVSKITYDESSRIFYSESMFQFVVRGPDNATYIPEPVLNLRRMMKIELVFDWEERHDCHLKMLNSEGTLRDSLTITSNFGPQERGDELIDWLSKGLEAFKSFRTVILKINPDKYPFIFSNDEAEQMYITRVIKKG